MNARSRTHLSRSATVLGLSLLATLAACGSSGATGGPFSCDFPGSQHTCMDYSCASVDDNPDKCTSAGGMLVNSCSHAGAVGGCTISLGSREGGCTRTEWDYYDMISTIMAACTAGDGTFHTP